MLNLPSTMVCPKRRPTTRPCLILRISVLLRICKLLVLIPLSCLVLVEVLQLMELITLSPLLAALAALGAAVLAALRVVIFLVRALMEPSAPPQALLAWRLPKTLQAFGLAVKLLKASWARLIACLNKGFGGLCPPRLTPCGSSYAALLDLYYDE